MTSTSSSVGQKTLALSSPLLAAALTLAFLGLSGGTAGAQSETTRPNLAAGAGIEPGAKQFEELDAKNFDRSENIDHAWWPLTPGMQWVYEGFTEEDGERTPHRITFTVTDLIKVIGGVRTRVILDADYSKGKLIEKELTFFAQDKLGNVWHLGQYRETYENEFIGGRIWNIGNPEGAKAGIMMPADPRPGTPSYSEGYAPAPFNWTDRGRVYQTGQKVEVPAGSYDDVLVIEEFDAEHPGAFQLKYYARGVGNVRVGHRGDDSAGTEALDLVKAHRLSANDLAEARTIALELEKRASMYPALPPLERIPLAEQ